MVKCYKAFLELGQSRVKGVLVRMVGNPGSEIEALMRELEEASANVQTLKKSNGSLKS